eukprot:6197038-Pleurochrysis_carterae.AAC.2
MCSLMPLNWEVSAPRGAHSLTRARQAAVEAPSGRFVGGQRGVGEFVAAARGRDLQVDGRVVLNARKKSKENRSGGKVGALHARQRSKGAVYVR